MTRIAVAGSISCDHIYELSEPPLAHTKLRAVSKTRCLGGSATITAAWLGQLGHSVQLFGHVGNDSDGDWCMSELAKCPNLDISHVKVLQGATGVAVVLSSGDDKRIVTFKDSNTSRLWTIPEITGHDHLHVVHPDNDLNFDGSLSATMRNNPRMTMSIDLNGRSGMPYLRHADVAFTNLDEVRRAFQRPFDDIKDSILSSMSTMNPVLVVTMGSEGAASFTGGASWTQLPTENVEIVDRTGAGDSFNAGYLDSFLSHKSIKASLERGLAIAAECLRGMGGIPWLS